MWFQCGLCIFASNSPKKAAAPTEQTGHTVQEEAE